MGAGWEDSPDVPPMPRRQHGEDSMMLVCEACDKGYHTFCMEPAIEGVPADSWKCKVCPAAPCLFIGEHGGAWIPTLTCILSLRTAGCARIVAGVHQSSTPAANGTRASQCARAASSSVQPRKPKGHRNKPPSWNPLPRRELG